MCIVYYIYIYYAIQPCIDFVSYGPVSQLIDSLESLKYQFEQAVKIANFSEIGRVKDLMKRVDQDIAVSIRIYFVRVCHICACAV
jgi:hypothetical protein